MKLTLAQTARRLVALAAGSLALSAWGYDPMPFPAGGDGLPDSRPPVLTTRVTAVYPSHLAGQKIEGDVWVAFIVDTTGQPGNVRAFFSRHADLEPAAVDAVKQWRFTPALACGGRLVKTQMVVSIHFTPPKPAE